MFDYSHACAALMDEFSIGLIEGTQRRLFTNKSYNHDKNACCTFTIAGEPWVWRWNETTERNEDRIGHVNH